MTAIAAIIGFVGLVIAFCCGFFLLFVQPIWTIVDVACCKKLSGGAKATLIVLTLVLLGPLLTFFYALFGTQSRGLRKTTIAGAAVFAVAVGVFVGMAGLGAAFAPTTVDADTLSVTVTDASLD